MKKEKLIHIIIILIGIIFILLPSFHSSLWFDESYSVAIAKHGFLDIWNITAHDVHPALYYWGLHIIYLIFGTNILIFRLFSVLAIAVLGILGYTHIRKDFGEKTGILFSFLTYFLPVMCTYASEIRMYSWSLLLVSLMAIYGYRIYRDLRDEKRYQLKNIILFGIFSICCLYIHYYALAAAGLINLLLLIFLIKNRKNDWKPLRDFLILAVIQIILYIPWVIVVSGQVNHVKSGFWIKLGWLNTTVEVVSLQFRRYLDKDFIIDFHTILALISSLAMCIYIGFRIRKAKNEKQDIKPGILSLIIYVGVIILVYIVSKIITPILFARYLMVVTGLYIFTIAFFMAMEKRKYMTYIVCAVVLLLGIISNIWNLQTNYSHTNLEPINYIKEQIKDDDILIYSTLDDNAEKGGVIAAYFPKNQRYCLNFAYWDIVEAYKAYSPGFETVENGDFLKQYKGRIWLIDTDNMELYNKLPKEKMKILKETKKFDAKYHNYIYNVILLEKE